MPVLLPDRVVSMTPKSADALLALGNGDAALLYLALLRQEGELPAAQRALGWTEGRRDAAYAALLTAGLVAPPAPGPAPAPPAPAAPEYVTRDILAALEGDSAFAQLQEQVEQRLGRLLSPADLKALYSVYDYLALPPEVILLLTAWCVEEMERKYGPGQRPRLSQIKKTAQRWHDSGLDTLEAADGYLRRQAALRGREGEVFPLIGVRDRQPLDREREYVATWLDWGFSPEAIQLAYQKTVMKKQSMSWPYMNSILKNWHGKGLHTCREIEAGDKIQPTPPRREEKPAQKASRRMAQDLADLKRAAKKEG